jgi:hypothetical protein
MISRVAGAKKVPALLEAGRGGSRANIYDWIKQQLTGRCNGVDNRVEREPNDRQIGPKEAPTNNTWLND